MGKGCHDILPLREGTLELPTFRLKSITYAILILKTAKLRLGGFVKKRRRGRRQSEDHHFRSPLALAVMAAALPDRGWIAKKTLLVFIQ
jgi:hypothetical protein